VTAGSDFRKRIADEMDLEQASEVWRAQLYVVVEHMDLCERLAGAVADSELVVDGSKGQPRISPLVGELRQARQTLVRMLAVLGIDDGPESFSDRQRRYATQRWRTTP
jgi:hypothetical protein